MPASILAVDRGLQGQTPRILGSFGLHWTDDENMNGAAMAKAQIKNLFQQAQQGDPQAQYQLGYLHTRGEGVSLDYSIAADYLSKSSHGGNADAQFLLGALYQQGKGVAPDFKKAVDLYL
ncbi:MAG: TPR repeat protein, partial [Limisphaerales bacterium]